MYVLKSKNVSKQRSSTANLKNQHSRNHVAVSAVVENSPNVKVSVKCSLCQGGHKLWNCNVFKANSVEERSKYVKLSYLCYNCLQPGHELKECTFKWNYRERGKKHNTVLHYEKPSNNTVLSEEPSSSVSNERVLVACNSCDSSQKTPGRKLHKVVPVKIWEKDPNKSIYTWAYMDDGSETSLCTTAFASRLGVSLYRTNVKMCTNNAVTTVGWQIKDLYVQGVEEEQIFCLKQILVQDSIVDVNTSILRDEITAMFPHLTDLSFPKIDGNEVEMLLGQNVQNAFRVSEFRYGKEDQPFGLHTALGWSTKMTIQIYGCI